MLADFLSVHGSGGFPAMNFARRGIFFGGRGNVNQAGAGPHDDGRPGCPHFQRAPGIRHYLVKLEILSGPGLEDYKDFFIVESVLAFACGEADRADGAKSSERVPGRNQIGFRQA